MNYQDVDVYLVNAHGAYLYNAKDHVLFFLVNTGNYRSFVAGTQKNIA